MSSADVGHPVRQLVGYDKFKRSNPRSDKFEILCFHHIEFYCSDSTNVSRRFSHGLGMPIVATSNNSTGNFQYSSTIIRSHALCFVFTAPYGISFTKKMEEKNKSLPPHPGYEQEKAQSFISGENKAITSICAHLQQINNYQEHYSSSLCNTWYYQSWIF